MKGSHKPAREVRLVILLGAWICCWVERREAGRSPTTPLECVNERERGQEGSVGSTTEVLTEGIEGLRLHLFRPSTLPAGLRQSLSLLLASVMGAGGQSPPPALAPPLLFLVEERRETLEAPSAEGSPPVSVARPGKGVAGASAALPRGSRSGRPQ
ncbi:uncharacterized protein AKAME5_001418300 [Lates japonicus]|uniref:Uncharacterized protein n=1 Tax=Lates japonicus TaxID=270547 RepID=A0AAD3MZS1_LATJO|nr:uncharacterized protein AKAME5_001418300 [Lates japonicus]